MPASVRVRKGVERIVFIHTEMLRRNENRSAGSQGNVAFSFPYGSCADRSRRVISGTGDHFHAFRQIQLLRDLRQQRSHHLITLIHLRQLLQAYAADLTHFLRPAAVLHIKQQHAGCVGHISAMHSGKPVGQIILGQHDL